MLAINEADYLQAIRYFHEILVREPSALRVRLELGRAFFLSHDYENAYRQFQFARAGKLPPGVDATIDKFVAAIRRDKNWSYSFGVAIAPDTNINNGTSSMQTELFGLPFKLGDETRRRSGTGLVISGSGEFAPRVSETLRIRLGAAFERREYETHDFDDMTVAAFAGPRIQLHDWDLSVLATGFRRMFGGRTLSEGAGARIEAEHGLGARTAISFRIAAQEVRYRNYALQDGQSYSASLGVIRAVTRASAANVRLAVSHHSARAPELASWSGRLSAGYYRDLPAGFSTYIEPAYTVSRYDGSDPFFGKRRNDRLVELQIAVLNRRIVMSRFTPRVTLTIVRRYSTVDIYDFTHGVLRSVHKLVLAALAAARPRPPSRLSLVRAETNSLQ